MMHLCRSLMVSSSMLSELWSAELYMEAIDILENLLGYEDLLSPLSKH